MGITHALYVLAGSTYGPERYPVLDPAGALVDVSTWSAAMTVRASQGPDSEIRYQGVLTRHFGYVELIIPDEDSAAWSWRAGYYDILLTDPLGVATRIAQGPVFVDPRTT